MNALSASPWVSLALLGLSLAISAYNLTIFLRRRLTVETRTAVPLVGPLLGFIGCLLHEPWRVWVWVPLVIDVETWLLTRHLGYLWREVKVFTVLNLTARYETVHEGLKIEVRFYSRDQGALTIQPVDGANIDLNDCLNAHFVATKGPVAILLRLRLGRGAIRAVVSPGQIQLHPVAPVQRERRGSPPFPLDGLVLQLAPH